LYRFVGAGHVLLKIDFQCLLGALSAQWYKVDRRRLSD